MNYFEWKLLLKFTHFIPTDFSFQKFATYDQKIFLYASNYAILHLKIGDIINFFFVSEVLKIWNRIYVSLIEQSIFFFNTYWYIKLLM